MLNTYAIKLQLAVMDMEDRVHDFLYNEDGEVNIIAMIIILAIALALAIVFRTSLKNLFTKIWTQITSNADQALGTY